MTGIQIDEDNDRRQWQDRLPWPQRKDEYNFWGRGRKPSSREKGKGFPEDENHGFRTNEVN